MDAAVVVVGVSVADVTVSDGEGVDVAGEVAVVCGESNYVIDHYCRVSFQPDERWIAGATYTVHMVSGEYAYTGQYGYSDDSMSVVADGHAVTPVSGAPDVEVLTVGNDTANEPCAYSDAHGYDLRITPAAPDPDALSYVLLERRDGYRRFMGLSAEGNPFDWTVWSPAVDPDDDCFRVTQVDGAGNASNPSEWRCVSDVDSGCGCTAASSGGNGVRSGLILASIGAWARRRRDSPTPSEAPGPR